MSLFLEMKDFGEAAPFLRKTNLEQLAAQAHAFDGTVNWFSIVNSLRTVTSTIEQSSIFCGFREVLRANAGENDAFVVIPLHIVFRQKACVHSR